MKSYVVVFSGIPQTSKSIIAQHLSCTFDLPILSNNIIRSEVKEDLLVDDINVPEALQLYELRRDKRVDQMLASKKSFVMDASVDRRWASLKVKLQKSSYKYYLINMELSESFLNNLYTKTGRKDFLKEAPGYLKQHKAFIDKYAEEIGLQINDEHFLSRLQLAETGLRSFLKNLNE